LQVAKTARTGNEMGTTTPYHETLSLMHALMDYRHRPIYRQLRRFGKRESMLHPDALQMIYHFARVSGSAILEIGAFRGGSTVAAALGLRDSGTVRRFITIEPGGALRHHPLATREILRRLKRNLAREDLVRFVTVLEGRSFEPHIIGAVERALASEQVGLLIFDADPGLKRDLTCYGPRMKADCWVVIDDYGGAVDNDKSAPIKNQVDELVASGNLVPLGYYGLATWVGKWRPAKSLPGQ
jgi:predicted O-methyltransferase YrrM